MSSSATVKFAEKEGEISFSEVNSVDFMGLYLDFYVQNPVEAVPKECFPNLKKLISLAASYLPLMPPDWSFAWNVSMPLQKRKLFCCIDAEYSTFVARSHSWNPSPYEKNPRMSVQMVSGVSGMESVTTVDCEENVPSDRILNALFKKFFIEESQNGLEIYENGEIFGIRDTLLEDFDGNDGQVREVELKFKCGCTKSKISDVFRKMAKNDVDFLFESDQVLSVECPRCGQKYRIKKDDVR